MLFTSAPSSTPSQRTEETFFCDLIPDLEARIENFRTNSAVIDDEILNLFAEQMRVIIHALQHAIHVKDVDEIRRQAHSLQGMGGTAGAPEISVVGEELSRYAKKNDLERCRQLTERLDVWQNTWEVITPFRQEHSFAESPRLTGHILIVDDELPNRLYLRKLLQDQGATVSEAESGELALELAHQCVPDLALVDVVMPGKSGYEVCQQLRASPETNQVSVIMVTARSTVEDIEHAFVLGAFDYIRKPFHPRELLARVHNALQLKRQGDKLRKWQNRMTRELDAAGALQRKLLPTAPFFTSTAEVRFAYQSSMSVGGDVFSAFMLPNGNLCVYVGDVAGHGVGAALVSTLLKVVIEEAAHDYFDHGPAVICNHIHQRFKCYVTNPEIYATLFLAVVNDHGFCTAFNCGHPAPLLFDAHGNPAASFADRGGMPIGLSLHNDATPYATEDEVHATLPPGGSMALFSDGILEARHTITNTLCGLETISTSLAQALRNPETIDSAQATFKHLEKLEYPLTQDDCTLAIIRQADPNLCRLSRRIPITYQAVSMLASDVKQCLLDQGWLEDPASAAQLLVMEHGANVVDHDVMQPDAQLTLHLSITETHATLQIREPGREWDFQSKLQLSEKQNSIASRGRGLQIIRTIAKHIDKVRQNRENISLYVISRTFMILPTSDAETPSKERV